MADQLAQDPGICGVFFLLTNPTTTAWAAAAESRNPAACHNNLFNFLTITIGDQLQQKLCRVSQVAL